MEKRQKNQRCVETDNDGTPCSGYVSEEWACIRCGRRACKRHSQRITFSNFGNEGVACLCGSCMYHLGRAPDAESGSAIDLELMHRQARQTYDEMLELATTRQIRNFRHIAEAALRDPAIQADPLRSRSLRALLALDEGS